VADNSLFERGRAALLAGQYGLARRCFADILDQQPESPECWFLLGATAHRMQDLGTARHAFSMASALNAKHVQARIALAMVCIELDDSAQAVAACLQAVAIEPSDQQSWFSLGVAQEADGALEAALESYDHALFISPDLVDAKKNRGALLLALGRLEEAIQNNRAWAAKTPFAYDAQFNLGETLLAARQFPGAAQALSRAVSLNPGNAKGLLHAGFALAQCERFAEAQRLLDRAAQLDQVELRRYRQAIFGNEKGDAQRIAAHLDARALFLLRHYDQIERCNWSEREHFIARFSQLIRESETAPMTERALGFRAMAMGIDGDLQLALARQIASGVRSALGGQGTPQATALTSRAPQGPIRIGYLSPYFRNHPTGLLAQSLFAWHDRERFEVVAYALGGDDGGPVRQKIAASCDRFVELDPLDDEAAAKKIAGDCIDILVDLMGYADQSRPGILARRPAPIQIAWLEYVATTGADWVDYLIVDDICISDAESSNFSEALIRVPDGRCLCSYAVNAPSGALPSRKEVGLPDEGLVLGALHNAFKIDPTTFAVWMRLMALRPDAILYLLEMPAEARECLRQEAHARGIDPGRLIFAQRVSHDHHLSRLRLVDLMLDTPQCNGGTTTADALVAGVPVLTCIGRTFPQRMAASMLTTAGLSCLIVEDLGAYESLAAELLADNDRLNEAKQMLCAARSWAPFFAPQQWVLHYETALVQAWQRHAAGEAPTSFRVEA